MSPPTNVPLPRSTPEAEGLDSQAILDLLDAAAGQGPAQELHSLMILRHGRVVAEGWWAPYTPERRHLLYSLSKSFTSSAVGIAVGEGLLSLDNTVHSFFPDKTPANPSDNQRAMTVRHLLTMSAGQRSEPWANLDGRNCPDWVSAFLHHPVEDRPGTTFLYNSIATFMLSAILQRVTAQNLLEYLRPRLFEPLGIDEAVWEVNPDGIAVGGWGLSVRTESIAKFGQLYLQDGVWNGRRLLPEGWVADATASHIDNGPNESLDWASGYGYQFWRCQHNCYRGDGAFGQLCVVVPQEKLVVAATARVEQIDRALNLVWDHLLPAVQCTALPPGDAVRAELMRRLSDLSVAGPTGDSMRPIEAAVTGCRYRGSGEEFGTATWRFGAAQCELHLTVGAEQHTITAGRNRWLVGECGYDNARAQPIAAWGAWTEEDTYTICLQYLEEPASTLFVARFLGGHVSLTTTRRGRFVDAAGPCFEGDA